MEPENPIEYVEEHIHEPRFGGYDFMFADELLLAQTCSICLLAMRNPVQTICGHRFCEDCLLGTFRYVLLFIFYMLLFLLCIIFRLIAHDHKLIRTLALSVILDCEYESREITMDQQSVMAI